nr:metal transporter Nramp3-like [Ipomoea batatas]
MSSYHEKQKLPLLRDEGQKLPLLRDEGEGAFDYSQRVHIHGGDETEGEEFTGTPPFSWKKLWLFTGRAGVVDEHSVFGSGEAGGRADCSPAPLRGPTIHSTSLMSGSIFFSQSRSPLLLFPFSVLFPTRKLWAFSQLVPFLRQSHGLWYLGDCDKRISIS